MYSPFAAACSWPSRSRWRKLRRPYWLDDLKLFAVTVLGGLVFFGTFIA